MTALSRAWTFFVEWFSERPHTAAAICRGDPNVERCTRFVDGACVWWPDGEWEGVPKVLDPDVWSLMATAIEMGGDHFGNLRDIRITRDAAGNVTGIGVNVAADVSRIVAQRVNVERVFRGIAIEARARHPVTSGWIFDEARALAAFRAAVAKGANESLLLGALDLMSETKGDAWLGASHIGLVAEWIARIGVDGVAMAESTGELERLRQSLYGRAFDRALLGEGKLMLKNPLPGLVCVAESREECDKALRAMRDNVAITAKHLAELDDATRKLEKK